MIQHVYERCLQANTLSKVIVATDNQLIYDVVKDFGGEVMVTSDRHRNGTSRCAEVADKFANEYDYIINIQGDEPLINQIKLTNWHFYLKMLMHRLPHK